MMLGPWQIAIIVFVLLLLFGGARLAAAGKGLGEGIRNFRRALKDRNDDPAIVRIDERSAELQRREAFVLVVERGEIDGEQLAGTPCGPVPNWPPPRWLPAWPGTPRRSPRSRDIPTT